MLLSPDQEELLRFLLGRIASQDFSVRQYAPWFVGGYAGTGKTTVIQSFLSSGKLPSTAVCAFTGKAVSVLREKGLEACTLHRLMYYLDERETEKTGYPVFQKKAVVPESLVVVDEASQISQALLNDLVSFGLRCVFVGDHGQLPPVGDNLNLMESPDFVLEQIHRQAADSRIVWFSSYVRRDHSLTHLGNRVFGNDEVILFNKQRAWDALELVDQILVGTNRERQSINAEIRRRKGFRHAVCPGDKLVCLRNDYKFNIYNGQLFRVRDIKTPKRARKEWIYLELEEEVSEGVWDVKGVVPAHLSQFGDPQTYHSASRKACLFDYGYALTVHKAQGSEWGSVLVIEPDFIPRKWIPWRWRYTAVTRAKNRLLYAQ